MTDALRPYQEVGAGWLSARQSGVLGDEMGLGKTPQAIVAAERIGAMKVIVVCPGVLRDQWAEEIKKFSSKPRLVKVVRDSKGFSVGYAEIIIVSYDLISRPTVRDALMAWGADVLICDEAHFLRNREAKRAVALLGHSSTGAKAIAATAKRTWFVSGTLAPNSVLDYYPFLRFTGAFTSSFIDYRRRYTEGYEGEHGYVVTRNKNVADLKRRIAKIMLRRTKRQVLPDLPPVSVVNLSVEPVESPAGDHFILNKLPDIDRELADEIEHFAKTGKFKHPNNVASARRALSMTKVLPMCQLIDEELKGDPSTKVLIFGIHAIGLKFVRAFLSHHGAKLLFGGTPANKRQQFIDEFQTSPRVRVMVAQIQLGGVGLNLTAANSVWIFEPSWLPDENDQAVARSVRFGQERPVMVRFVSAAGTIDNVVNKTLVKRSSLLRELWA